MDASPQPGTSCPTCGTQIAPEAKFCTGCGTPVARFCPSCGADLKGSEAFCGACGVAIRVVPPPPPGYAPIPGPGGVAPAISQYAQFPGYAAPVATLTAFGAPTASWGKRVASHLLDWLLLLVPVVFVFVIISKTLASGIDAGGHWWILLAIWVVISGLYFCPLHGLGPGQTVGNMATGLAVRDASDGGEIGLERGIARWVVRMLLYIALVVPGIVNDLWPLWDKNRQTLADKAAKTVMIRAR